MAAEAQCVSLTEPVRGTFHFKSQDPAHYSGIYLRWVASEFRSLDSGLVTVRDSRVIVRRGAFGPPRLFSPLTDLNSGWVVAVPNELGVDVRFELKFPEAVIEGCVAVAVALAAVIATDELWRLVLGLFAAALGLGAVLHYDRARTRAIRTLRGVAKRVEQVERETRADLGGPA